MNELPLYIDIHNDIKNKISSGEYPENFPLPAERTLSSIYRVSRSTVRHALDKLEKEGIIFKAHGNGNFVKPQIFEQQLRQFYSFTDSLKNAGIIITNQIIDYEIINADESLEEKLGCGKEEAFHKITRLRSAKKYPLMIETTFLPRSRFYHMDIEYLQTHSLYVYLRERYNMNVTRGKETLFPVIPKIRERALLCIPPNVPCTIIERQSYEEDVLIEYTKSIVRGDKYKFTAELYIGNEVGATKVENSRNEKGTV
jgi:GntR family transcriptional regulator